jgi:hypothetical protein
LPPLCVVLRESFAERIRQFRNFGLSALECCSDCLRETIAAVPINRWTYV